MWLKWETEKRSRASYLQTDRHVYRIVWAPGKIQWRAPHQICFSHIKACAVINMFFFLTAGGGFFMMTATCWPVALPVLLASSPWLGQFWGQVGQSDILAEDTNKKKRFIFQYFSLQLSLVFTAYIIGLWYGTGLLRQAWQSTTMQRLRTTQNIYTVLLQVVSHKTHRCFSVGIYSILPDTCNNILCIV